MSLKRQVEWLLIGTSGHAKRCELEHGAGQAFNVLKQPKSCMSDINSRERARSILNIGLIFTNVRRAEMLRR